jgi:hypothetical protein
VDSYRVEIVDDAIQRTDYPESASEQAFINDVVHAVDALPQAPVPASEFVFSPLDLAARTAAGTTACWRSDSSGATTAAFDTFVTDVVGAMN